MSPPAKTDARSDPVISAADGTPEGEWSICSTGPSVSMKAIEACTRLIAIGESIPPSRRAEVFFRRGQLKEQLLSLKSPDKTEQAEILDDYNAAIGLDQTRPSVYLARALLTVNMGGDGKRAIADLSEVIRLDPGIARAYLVRGLQYAKQGDLDGALTDVSKSIELAPDSVAYESRAEIFLKKDKMASAFADLDAAVRLAPKNSLSADILKEKRDRIGRPLAKVYAERGRVAAQNGDTDLAVLDFNSALEYDPDNWRANYDRGAIYLQRGELDKARADIRAATQQFTRTKPSDWPVEIATAHVWLGEIYEKKRLLSAALLEYDEALKAPQYLNDAEGVRARADRIRSQAK
ncbi:MAG: tetratricopeptide repeat protein [Hyphomicrobium sp.]